MMRVLLADDEPFSIRRLTHALKDLPDVEVVGTATNGPRTISEIHRLRPDLVILDIAMPGCSGLTVASSLDENRPDIVFVTAFDQYAIDAFQVDATDYLLKPVKPERLRTAIDRARRRQSDRLASQQVPTEPSRAGEQVQPALTEWVLYIPQRGGGTTLPQSEILWIEAAKDYALIHTILKSHILRTTMSDLAAKLRPSIIRVHRSAYVAVEAIRHWRKSPKGVLILTLTDGSQVTVSPNYVHSLRTVLL